MVSSHGARTFLAIVAFTFPGCSDHLTPTQPTGVATAADAAHAAHGAGSTDSSRPMDAGDKGYIDGWFDGETVQLYYTKTFFCVEPPDSAAATHCEIGEDAVETPRPGPIPTIYAVAWTAGSTGVFPNFATFSCAPGTTCLNHPSMIDISRIRPGATTGPGLPHSHIVTERRGGWFKTVNVRVANLDVWNEIATAKSLDKVRELQADAALVQSGAIGLDTPTNIFFFIASWR